MAKTIKEIAAECGVSEQAVRGWCRRNHVAKDAKGSFALSESQKSSIYLHYLGVERNEVSQPAKASCETCETSETVLISMLQKELDRKETQLSVKDKQLAVKDEQIRELNARLAECSTALLAVQETARAALLAVQETARAAQALHAGTIQQQLSDGEDRAAASVPDGQAASNNRRWFSRFFRR
nr:MULTISPECIES: hypothetical protein [unclassified Butyricicoccus]